MNKGRYSKIADFKKVEILTKAYKKYFTVPKEKNHIYFKYKKYLDHFLQQNKNNPKMVRLKKSYKHTIEAFMDCFNSNPDTKCKLSENNVFAFLLVFSESCLKNGLEYCYSYYINSPEYSKDLTDFLQQSLTDALNSIFFCSNASVNIKSLNYNEKILLLKLLLFLKHSQFRLDVSDLE